MLPIPHPDRFCEQQNVSAHKLNLITLVRNSAAEDLINRALGLILMKRVKVLVIDIDLGADMKRSLPMYRVPVDILLSASSLKSLTVSKCEMPSSLMVDVVKFKYLKMLELERVPLNEEAIKRLTTICPLLEALIVKYCHGFKTFSVYGLQNLQKFGLTLRMMLRKYVSMLQVYIILTWCILVEEGFHLRTWLHAKKLISFRYVAKLSINLSHPCNFGFVSSWQMEQGEVVKPFTEDKCIPVKSTHGMDPKVGVDAVWFKKLRRFLDKKIRFKVLKLCISAFRSNYLIDDVEELKVIQSAPYKLKHIELEPCIMEEVPVYVCHHQSLILKLSFPRTNFEEWSHIVTTCKHGLVITPLFQFHSIDLKDFTLVKGSPSRNSRWLRQNQSQGGGLEIVFNQQLTRLGYYLISCVIAPSAKITSITP
ncbi:F-box domain, Leucine-rich repeat domain, L domain-like protein [Artemisia annua]|uniref:F-box domain, Leucine-rich repeat domain, L domain-like protein n=1 Tax=Artemisia annua TaxID=35608 RepID=A0A2U1LBM3_ARTAN|nr:F-box domain, Leucine-rich repeat domain, L domain-like protein [Artemisia annua]